MQYKAIYVKLGKLFFPTKGGAQKYISSFITNHEVGYIFNEEEFQWCAELFNNEYHKIRNPKQFRIATTGFRRNTIEVVLENGETMQPSYKKALLYYDKIETEIMERNEHRRLVVSAFRGAISDQILDFINEQFREVDGIECEKTGDLLTLKERNFHVDHNYNFEGKKFHQIYKGFMQENNLKVTDIELIDKMGSQCEIKDEGIRDKWLNYHKQNCSLRIIHKRANLREL